jgi:hypothetical protein
LEARIDTRQSGRDWAAIRSGVKCRCVGSTGLWLPGSVKGCSRSAPDSTSTCEEEGEEEGRTRKQNAQYTPQHAPCTTQHTLRHTQDRLSSLLFDDLLAYLDDLWVIVHDGSNKRRELVPPCARSIHVRPRRGEGAHAAHMAQRSGGGEGAEAVGAAAGVEPAAVDPVTAVTVVEGGR